MKKQPLVSKNSAKNRDALLGVGGSLHDKPRPHPAFAFTCDLHEMARESGLSFSEIIGILLHYVTVLDGVEDGDMRIRR
jgi:hypothetical protein